MNSEFKFGKEEDEVELDSQVNFRKASKKITYFEYLYVFILIIYAGRASTFVLANSVSDNLIGFFLPLILSIILFIEHQLSLDKQFFKIAAGVILYLICLTIKYHEFYPSLFFRYLSLFFIVFTIIRAFGFSFFFIYEKLIYYLAIVSLFFWGIQTVLGGDGLLNILSKIPGIHTFSNVTGEPGGVNIVIYTVQVSASSLLDTIPIPRNCGFGWEPGAFGVYLSLALFINLFITNYKKKWNKFTWILLITLISTMSTTGYSILALIILFYFYNLTANSMILILPLLIIVAGAVIVLPFVSEKIKDMYEEANNVDFLVLKSIGQEDAATPQRFSSFLIAVRDFYQNPFLGTGTVEGKRWIDEIGANITVVSGIGQLMGSFGIVGSLFFLISSLKSSFIFSKYFKYKGKFLLFFLIIFISISYFILFIPVILTFWTLGDFTKVSFVEAS